MNKKILLINPPVPSNKTWIREGRCQQIDMWGSPFPPLSLALCSRQLLKEKFKTKIIDSAAEKKDIKEVLDETKKFSPFLVILPTTTPTINSDLNWFAKKLKNILPNVKIAVIGIHVSALPKETLKNYEYLDYIIIGEPEITIKKLAIELLKKRKKLTRIKGISFKNKKNEIIINKKRPFIKNLDSLGFPNWEKIHLKNYIMPIRNKPFLLINFSRGCPFSCEFCATQIYNGKKVRKRNIENIIKEIKYNINLGVVDFLFLTEIFTLNTEYLNKFLDKLISENLHKKIKWVCNSRIDTGNYKLFKKMKKAGCWQIAFGFEFGDNKILKLSKKGGNTNIKQAIKISNLAYKAKLVIDGHFILGYPGETKKTIEKTIKLACKLPLTFAHFYSIVPFPGSILYKKAIKNNWIKDSSWGKFNQETSLIETKELTIKEVNKLKKKAYKKFYIRPKILYRVLNIPKNLNEYFNLFKLGIKFIINIIIK